MTTRARLSLKRLIDIIGSRGFFWTVVVIFVFESAWIALTARYPQAFDEQFHLGIIQLYAHQWSPFFAHQPAGADQFGAVARDPSYLYHYLMSFPWRAITHIVHDFATQVILMRFINIIMLASSLFIFRKLLLMTPASKPLVHTTLLFLVLTPVMPLLGSQINYDNAMIPLTGLAVWGALRVIAIIKDEHRLPLVGGLWLLALCLLASLVKYAFLPIFAAIVLLIGLTLWREARNHRLAIGTVLANAGRLARKWASVLAALFTIVSLGLFTARYGINLVRYHTPTPECDQVLSVQECMAYTPWERNYQIVQNKVSPPAWQVATYTFDWLYHSMGELIFTIGSSFNTSGTVDYYVGTQFISMEILAWTIFGAGVVLSIYYAKRIWRNEVLRWFVVVIGIYVLALWGQNYMDYIHTGQPVAIHGRYLLPVLPLIYIIVALAFRKLLQSRHLLFGRSIAGRKLTLTAAVVVILLTQGGGAVTYIMRSDPRWLWPDDTKAAHVNAKAKKILKPVVIGD